MSETAIDYGSQTLCLMMMWLSSRCSVACLRRTPGCRCGRESLRVSDAPAHETIYEAILSYGHGISRMRLRLLMS